MLVPTNATNIVAGNILSASGFAYNASVDQFASAQSAFASSSLPNFGPLLDTSGSNKTLIANQSYAATGSPTYTLPVPFPGARVKVTNYSSGSVKVQQNASEVIYGSGCTTSGVASILLNSPGATATLESLDGTNWFITAGQQDSGWITVANGSMSNAWVNGSPAFGYRLIGNIVRLRGLLTTGTSNTTALTLPAGYRPATTGVYASIQGVNVSFSNIASSGTIAPVYSGTAQMYFDGVQFPVD